MRKKIGILLYIFSFILILFYFINNRIYIINNPLLRIISLITGSILMLIGAKLIDNDKLKRINITIWFILYLFVLLSLTLLNDYFYRGNKLLIFNQKYLNYYLEYYVNLKPFKMINSLISAYNNGYLSLKYLLINIGGNLILFTPFAFFLPRLFNKQKKFFIFFITISIIIIIIELLQLITFSGTCDIDDYILNITGSIISFCIFNNKYVYKILDKIIY